MDVKGPEKWLAELFSELIQRGIDSDEHIHYKDSPLGDCYAPNLQELEEVNLGRVMEKMYSILDRHLYVIVQEYRKLETKYVK